MMSKSNFHKLGLQEKRVTILETLNLISTSGANCIKLKVVLLASTDSVWDQWLNYSTKLVQLKNNYSKTIV